MRVLAAALCCTLAGSAGAWAQSTLGAAASTAAAGTVESGGFANRLNREQRLQDLGWRLASANAAFCRESQPSTGLQLLDTASFRRPDAIRRELGLEHSFAVLTAADGSPAEQAGLEAREPVTHINGFELESWSAVEPFAWQRAELAHDLLETMLVLHGQVTLSRPGKPDLTLKGEPACATRFELAGGDDIALADGKRVRISAGYPAFSYPQDELAAVIAHELAHNVLGHRVWLDANGRKQSNVRLTEREADRLAPWLLANAGFEPHAALRFINRWGPEHAGGLFRKRTHEGWDERAERIAAEIPLVLEAIARDGKADWSQHFQREIEP
ncbi:hypothetical protein [Altererythrobacter sp. GH1-8]|uniref:hypothetical protein n=1 Tax=Altererythrobacter sp. GH1-8 TaxID=3349333 RepID=UPI00374CB2E3